MSMISSASLLQLGTRPHCKPERSNGCGQLSESEVMNILIHFHQSHYWTSKAYYTEYVAVHLRREFPSLVVTRAL